MQGPAEEEGSWEVMFVDYGNREVVRSSELLPLMKELSMVPIVAFPCRLHGVEPVGGAGWTYDASKLFSDSVLDVSEVVITLQVCYLCVRLYVDRG